MQLTSPKMPSIRRHITVATSACHPVKDPPAITLQSSLGNSLVSTISQLTNPYHRSLSETTGVDEWGLPRSSGVCRTELWSFWSSWRCVCEWECVWFACSAISVAGEGVWEREHPRECIGEALSEPGKTYWKQNVCYTKKYKERLKQLRGNIMCVTSNGDSVAETTGLRIEVECCQTGNFMLFTGDAPPQAILVQRTASTSSPSPSPRCSSCSTCFWTEGKIYNTINIKSEIKIR